MITAITQPLPKRSYLRLAPSYAIANAATHTAELLARALFVGRGWGVPGFGPACAASGVRIDVPLRHAPGASGLGDVEALALAGAYVHDIGFGVGIGTVLPTATSPALGADALQLGPAFYADVRAIPHVDIALLARLLFPAAGADARTTEWATLLKPSILVELPRRVLLISDGEIEVIGLARHAIVPIDLKLGYAFAGRFVAAFGPSVIAAGRGRGDVTLDLELDWIIP